MEKIGAIVLVFCVFTVHIHAQTENEALQAYADALKAYDDAAQHLQRANLRAQKRAIIKKAVSLNSEQSRAFWPIYDKYEAKTTSTNDKRLALIMDYISQREDISPEKAADLINDIMRIQSERLESKRAYVRDLGKVLTAKQALRLLLLENQIDVQLDAQIASQIPLQ